MKVAYVVSRFPRPTETFIVREISRLDAYEDLDISLYSLFRGDGSIVHDDARPWLARLRRPSPAGAAAAFAHWLARAPGPLARVVARVVLDQAGSPSRLAKSLVTVVLALQHARRMEADGVDHIHAHFATYPALAAWVVNQILGVPYSITPHAHDVFVDQRGLETKLRRASFVVAVSEYHWMFLQHFGATPDRLVRLRYGLDLRRYAFQPRDVPESGPVDALMVSSFRPYKGHAVLLTALAGSSELDRVRVEFVGDGPLRPQIEALAAQLGVAGRCMFAGTRDQTYVRRRLADAHLLVQPSRVQEDGDTEGLPNTIIEAAACGVPVVTTRVAGIPDLIEDGVSGFLADPDAPADLARALTRALGHADLRPLLDEARRRVEEHHDLDHVIERLARVLSAPATA